MKFNEKDYTYLQQNEPLIVLALKVDPDRYRDYTLKPGRKFIKIAHQTAGVGCHQHYMVGTVLKPKWHIANNLKTLSDKWYDTCAGALGVRLDELVEYRADIKRLLQMDCNDSYQDFEEGIYPVDCTNANLQAITEELLPDHLDDLIQFEDSRDAFMGSLGRWNLYILGPNSD